MFILWAQWACILGKYCHISKWNAKHKYKALNVQLLEWSFTFYSVYGQFDWISLEHIKPLQPLYQTACQSQNVTSWFCACWKVNKLWPETVLEHVLWYLRQGFQGPWWAGGRDVQLPFSLTVPLLTHYSTLLSTHLSINVYNKTTWYYWFSMVFLLSEKILPCSWCITSDSFKF